MHKLASYTGFRLHVVGFDSLHSFVTLFSLQDLQEFVPSNITFLKNKMHHIRVSSAILSIILCIISMLC